MKILFVCSANKKRSRTAEDFMTEYFPGHEFESAGTNIRLCRKEGTTPITRELVEWADVVLGMEWKHVKTAKRTGKCKLGLLLSIEDIYEYGQPELIEKLRTTLQHIIPPLSR